MQIRLTTQPVLEAILVTADNWAEIEAFVGEGNWAYDADSNVTVRRFGGEHWDDIGGPIWYQSARPGDYVTAAPWGMWQVISADDFAAHYEVVS